MQLTELWDPAPHSPQPSEPPPPNKACKSNLHKKTPCVLIAANTKTDNSFRCLKLGVSIVPIKAVKQVLFTHLSPRIRDKNTKEEQEHCKDSTCPSSLFSAETCSKKKRWNEKCALHALATQPQTHTLALLHQTGPAHCIPKPCYISGKQCDNLHGHMYINRVRF